MIPENKNQTLKKKSANEHQKQTEIQALQ